MINTCTLEQSNQLIADIGTPACKSWRRKILVRHIGINIILARQYKATAEREDHVAANRELAKCDVALKLAGTGLYVHADDDEIHAYCKVKTRNLERDFTAFAKRFNVDYALDWIKGELRRAGLTLPLKDKDAHSREAQLSAVARAVCPKWWRRQLRTIAGRRLEQFLRERGQVCRQRSAYVSAQGLGRRTAQHSRNRKLLLSLEAISDAGDVVNLGEAADASISNPVNLRTELMVRMRGYEEVAGALGLQGEFLTLTCPSKYHPVLHKSGAPNPKYNGTDPRKAQGYLNRVWQRTRASWYRAGIRVFGFRVAEPHHDGTPHWHLLLFFPPEQSDQAWEIFRAHALAEDGDEWRAQDVRAQRVSIDQKRGTATGYLAKYISKNIDGYQVGEGGDLESETNAQEGARRVDAWAGIWGIRQFQQIGSTSVTVWREFRRLREALEDMAPDVLEEIRQAADAGDWARFVDLMGGALVTRDGQTVRAWMVERERENQYAETTERIKGLVLRAVGLVSYQVQTRVKTWVIQPAREKTRKAQPGRLSGATWTCVNNCTETCNRTEQVLTEKRSKKVFINYEEVICSLLHRAMPLRLAKC